MHKSKKSLDTKLNHTLETPWQEKLSSAPEGRQPSELGKKSQLIDVHSPSAPPSYTEITPQEKTSQTLVERFNLISKKTSSRKKLLSESKDDSSVTPIAEHSLDAQVEAAPKLEVNIISKNTLEDSAVELKRHQKKSAEATPIKNLKY